MGIYSPSRCRIKPRVLQASLVRLALGELVSSERYGDPAPKELTEERQPPERRAPVAVPDLMTAMGELVETTRFTDAPVPSEHVFEILRAGQWAPSAGNFQPIRYVVLRERERLAALDALARESAAVSAHWFPRYRQGAIDHPQWADVPAAVALIADPTKGGPHIHGEATHVIGGGLAAQNMRLMAHALGLGTSVITHWIEEKVKVLIECPRDWDLVGVMPRRYAGGVAGPSTPSGRRGRVSGPLRAPLHALTAGALTTTSDDSRGRRTDPGRSPRVAEPRSPAPEPPRPGLEQEREHTPRRRGRCRRP